MSEQERKPAPADAGASEPPASQEGDRIHQAAPTGGIHAETITQTTNVVSGEQHIGTQINYDSSVPSRRRTPPLQRPRPAEHFVDREAERARLLADLKLGRVVTVCGLGGMGKTALVAEVLWTLAPAQTPPTAFPDGILFYSFYGQPTVTIALEQLARTLGEKPVPTPALAAQRALSGQRVLLVLDGAEEADHLELLLAVCGGSAVLLTSRKRADAPDPVYRLDLQPLPEQKAVSVVQAFGGEQAADATATSRICACVGNLPMALRLVGRYLAEQEEEASAYLTWLEQAPLSALDQGISREKSVPLLLERSATQLSTTAQQVLRLVGILAQAAFDRALVAQTLELSEEVVRRVLGELVNYGLLVRQESRYKVSHPLIHTYARERMETRDDPVAQPALPERMVRVLDEQFPEVEYANWRRCEELLPHVQACAIFIAQHQLIFPEAGYLLTKAGWYLRTQAQYTQAAHLLQQALTIVERSLGSDHLYLGVILNNLAQLYRDQGHHEEAETLYQRALAIFEKALPPDHPDIATTLQGLAVLYRDQGRYEEAEPLYQHALVIFGKALPPDHLHTATTLENYAILLRKTNRSLEAQTLELEAFITMKGDNPAHDDAVRRRVVETPVFALGKLAQGTSAQGAPGTAHLLHCTVPVGDTTIVMLPVFTRLEHVVTAVQMNPAWQLLHVLQMEGSMVLEDLEEGEWLGINAWSRREFKLPPTPSTNLPPPAKATWQQDIDSGHPDTATSLNTLSIREQQLGPQHPDIAASLNNLALLYQAQGKYSQAEPLYQRALAIRKQQLGPTHPDTATSLNNLAALYSDQGKYEQAEPLYQRALAIREQQVGAQHPDTASSLNSLAVLYWNQGKYEQAEPLYQRALTIREQQLGPQHPDTATSLNNLALLYWTQGKYSQAEPLYQRALSIYEQQLGPQHPDTATSLNNLAALYSDQGKYEQAEPLYQRALAIHEQQLGALHPHTANSLNNLAELYRNQGKYEQAEPLYQRALTIREQQLGPQHPDTATSLNNLALLYWTQGKYSQAEPLYQRALSIYEQQLGPQHPDTATSLNNLALLYWTQGKYEQAEPLYQRALAIREQQLGPQHPHTATSLNNLAGFYQDQGKDKQAEPLYQRALSIYERALGPQHPTTQRIRANYARLLHTMGHDIEAAALDQP